MSPKIFCTSSVGLALLVSGSLVAQSKPAAKRETVAKPLTDKQIKAKERALKKELETPWKKWKEQDVAYIISGDEEKAFKQLNTDEEREQFVEQFWLRRDPTPDTIENEYREEHYRRIAYANEHYASGIPGWKTDRGRIYITFGPPDEIESHASGGSYQRPTEEGGGSTSTFPFEHWRYRYIEDVGSDITIEFVDTTMSNEYRMTMDPTEKDALLHVPNAGLTMYEEMGLSSKDDRFSRTDGTHLGVPEGELSNKMNQFNRMEQFFKLQKPPAIKFKDLEAQISTRITYNILPMLTRVDYVRVTDTSVIANITVQFDNRNLQFSSKEGVSHSVVNLLGRVSTMTHRPVTNFEKALEINPPTAMLQDFAKQRSIYQTSVPLAPGKYKLNVIAEDVVSGNKNNIELPLEVPRYSEDRLASSTLILADTIERLPTRSIGGGMFAIGDLKVRPRLGDKPVFSQDEKLGIYFQLYNFSPEDKTNKPQGEIQYEIMKAGTTEKVIAYTENLADVQYASANQVTVSKLLPLKGLAPGSYTLKVTAVDKKANQTLQIPAAGFTVN